MNLIGHNQILDKQGEEGKLRVNFQRQFRATEKTATAGASLGRKLIRKPTGITLISVKWRGYLNGALFGKGEGLS